jgi:pilus assembly protein Flp/PilA
MAAKPIPRWRSLSANRKAVTALEYALIASLIAILIVAGVTSIGSTLSQNFHAVAVGL